MSLKSHLLLVMGRTQLFNYYLLAQHILSLFKMSVFYDTWCSVAKYKIKNLKSIYSLNPDGIRWLRFRSSLLKSLRLFNENLKDLWWKWNRELGVRSTCWRHWSWSSNIESGLQESDDCAKGKGAMGVVVRGMTAVVALVVVRLKRNPSIKYVVYK